MTTQAQIKPKKPPQIFLLEEFTALRKPKAVKVFYGGRNSTKTETCGRQLLLNMESSESSYKAVCSRMYQNSIDESVYSMLQEFNQQYMFGYDDSANKIRNYRNNSIVTFQGIARNIKSIKSRFKANLFWVDEAEDVSAEAWDIIEPTFREENSEIWITFNPQHESDETYQRFVAPYIDYITRDGYFEDEDIYVRLVNYDKNPFITDRALRKIEKLKKENYKKYLHVYGGEPVTAFENAIIEPEWFDAAIDAHKKLGFEAVGERVAALDIADDGKDSKAYIERKGVVIEKLDEWTTGDLHDCISLSMGKATDSQVNNLVYDYGGMGRAVNVYLKARPVKYGFKIEGFDGGKSVDNPDDIYDDVQGIEEETKRINKDVFRNKRAQYYFYLADRFYRTWLAVTKGQYVDPLTLISISSEINHINQLRKEILQIPEKKTAGSLLKQIMSKPEMKAKLGYNSQNLADSLMMLFAITFEMKTTHYTPRPRTSWRA